ncbi:MAG: hypothetical protein M1396_04925 [Chloroflexi bacterium]|nr:hypothetical protein [Chloroflexota bacterium]
MEEHIFHAIENNLAHVGCPLCGSRLRFDRLLSQRSFTAVFSAHCEICGANSNRVCFTGDALYWLQRNIVGDDGFSNDSDSEGQLRTPGENITAISPTEVLEMRHFLSSFNGDFQHLFGLLKLPHE